MTRSASSARAAAKSAASAHAVISGPSSSSSRIRSPSAVPPGSRTATTACPARAAHSASSAACVVLPEPSMPSNVTNMRRLRYGRMRAVVTGAAGFIGSNLVDRLVADGDDVVAVDDLSTGKRENVNTAATFVERDIRDGLDLGTADVVFHLAAQADVMTSVARPDHDAAGNVVGTVKVLEAARPAGAQVVFSSTGGAIYGECDGPAAEDSVPEPLSPYGIAKLCAEQYLAGWNRIHGTGHVALRFGNVFGPRQEPSLEGGVVSIFLERLATGKPTTIFGDGGQTRDFVFVGDVVDAVLAAAGHRGGGVFNVGTGRETSVLELHHACAEVAGSNTMPSLEPARLGDVRRSALDVTAAERELGWRATTPLVDGLRATWDWVTA